MLLVALPQLLNSLSRSALKMMHIKTMMRFSIILTSVANPTHNGKGEGKSANMMQGE